VTSFIIACKEVEELAVHLGVESPKQDANRLGNPVCMDNNLLDDRSSTTSRVVAGPAPLGVVAAEP